MAEPLDRSTFRFLVTTDNHLGFMERDPHREEDSFVTFEECLAAARVTHDVDAMLLAGDLFHYNKPSLRTLSRAQSLFHRYVLGNRPVEFSIISDPAVSFGTNPLQCANFQDPNLNVALPVFIIHGNHDDPNGGASAIDLLSSCGLVNYFGHAPDLDDITLTPVLLKKGSTLIALYGLGNVCDDRLHRCFLHRKVHVVRPKEHANRYFSILLLHQNRGIRGGLNSKGGINESMLAEFKFDLIIWGNEHEQLMHPMPLQGCPSTDVVQPGSTVLTSLGAAESNKKQYGVISICGTNYKLDAYDLHSLRPIVRRTVELYREPSVSKDVKSVEDFLYATVEHMLEESEEQIGRIPEAVLRAHPNLKYPLIRLSVQFHDPQGTTYAQPNANRFGSQFRDKAANADILRPIMPEATMKHLYTSGRAANAASNGQASNAAAAPAKPLLSLAPQDMQAQIAAIFAEKITGVCQLMSEPHVTEAVQNFVWKEDLEGMTVINAANRCTSGIEETLSDLHTKCMKYVLKAVIKEDVSHLAAPRVAELVRENKTKANDEYQAMMGAANGAGEAGADVVLPAEIRDVRFGEPLPPGAGGDDDVAALLRSAGPPMPPPGGMDSTLTPPAAAAAGKKRAPAKRTRDDGTGASAAVPAAAPRRGARKEPTGGGPTLQLTTGGGVAPPPPPTAASGVANVSLLWASAGAKH